MDDAKYQALDAEVAAFTRSHGADKFIDGVFSIMPDKATRMAFCDWKHAKALARLNNRAKDVMTPHEFVRQIDTLNFLDMQDQGSRISDTFHKPFRPVIPIGKVGRYLYRLVPSISGLRAQYEDEDEDEDEDEKWLSQHGYPLLPPSVLGVNTTVQPAEPAQPASRRAANLSEQSTGSAESDDVEAPGFVFYQLGPLEYTAAPSEDQLPASFEDAANPRWTWQETGFVVVARLGPFGKANGIYILFDMFPREDEDDITYEWSPRVQITHGRWGILPSTPGDQFSCARLGDCMAQFGWGHSLRLSEVVEHPVELVRTVRTPHGGARRITVDAAFRK